MTDPTVAPSANQQRLGDIQTVANLLSVSAEHVRRLTDRGEIPPAIRLGRSLRWDLHQIRDWIDRKGQRQQPSAGIREIRSDIALDREAHRTKTGS